MENYSLGHNKVVSINFEHSTICSILVNGQELVSGSSSFFAIKLRKRDNSSLIIDGKDFLYRGKDEEGKHLYSHDLLEVKINVKPIEDSLSFNIDIDNKSEYLIEQVELASFSVNKNLSEEENGVGEIYVPYNEGARIRNMQKRENSPFCYHDVDYPSKGIYFVFPNMISSQFISYAANNAGVLLWMLDKKRTTKHIDFRYDNDAIRIQIRTFADVDYSANYKMSFETRLTLYEGDYYDACEIYRKWFKAHLPLGTKTILERYDELPSWYHDNFVVVTYPICGTKDSDIKMEPTKMYPYTNGYKYIDEISHAVDCPVMALLMQWESTAPWAPPYVWPPYGDVDNFHQFKNMLHENGHYFGLYTSGFGWTNISYRRNYNKEKEFAEENINDIVCVDSIGYAESTVVSNIRKGFDLCPSQEKSKELIVSETEKMINAGVDYIQVLDQNHGGCSYFCYSDKHGHIPAPGSWQNVETNLLLERINTKGITLLGCESAAAEPFIKNLVFSDNRMILNQYIGDYIPMYSYIYHEYVNNFMGNGICNLMENHEYSMTYRLAYSFLCGDILTLVIDDSGNLHSSWCLDTLVDKKVPYDFIKTLMKFRKDDRFFKFLHYGKMVKPISYTANIMHFNELYGYSFDYPAVLSTAFEVKNEVLQMFINYSFTEQKIIFKEDITICSMNEEKKQGKEITLSPLSIYYYKKSY